MSLELCAFDKQLSRRLPLPLAQLYRRAHNGKNPLERHLTAFYLWEAGLKLVASVAIIEYASHPTPDPGLAERLQSLARPALGHWWEYVRLLVPVLAEQGDPSFIQIRDLILGRTRDDFPRAAGLDVALRQQLDGQAKAQSTVRFTELFDRLVQYRNQVIGHAAPAQLRDDTNELMAGALLAGLTEIYNRLDVLAGRRLIYISEIRQVGGQWLVQRMELAGDGPQPLPSLELPHSAADVLPQSECLYLAPAHKPPNGSGDTSGKTGGMQGLRPLHPLLLYLAHSEECLFMISRRGKQRTQYLSYVTGMPQDHSDLGGEQRELLARVLGMEISEGQIHQWAEKSLSDEPATEREVTSTATPRMLGEFELLSVLGRGGMGTVYRAWQPSLRRQVALKKLNSAGNEKTESRFRREIRALGRVEHPHLVKIFTSGSYADHTFYVMELIDGAPLSAVCDWLQTQLGRADTIDMATWRSALSTVCERARQAERPLSDAGPGELGAPADPGVPEQIANQPPLSGSSRAGHLRVVVELVRQAALAAHALHEAGIIHRDIKPGNIMVTADGNHAVLMDLGLAQLADADEGRLTRTRQFVGTLRYASPQQVMAVGEVDRRTDVYSLGATLWELLTIKPLFGATEQTPTPLLMEQIQRDAPARVRSENPAVPKDLESVVHKCLEKRPEDRYTTAQDLANDLQRFLAGEPVEARPAGTLARALKWALRRPERASAYALATAVVVLLAIGGGFAWLSKTATESRDATKVAQQQTEAALGELKVAQANERKAAELVRRWHYDDSIRLVGSLSKDGRFAEAQPILDSCPAEFRSFEWYYLNELVHPELAILRGHTERLYAVAFSPDGRHLASASEDHTARLWDAASGKELFILRGHTGAVYHVTFSPGEQHLASASEDHTARLWDVATGKELFTLRGHAGKVFHVAFSPDGRRLASASEDQTARLWDAATGKVLYTLAGHEKQITHVVFSLDGNRLATASGDHSVKLWDVATGKEFPVKLRGRTAFANHVAFSPGGTRLASICDDDSLIVWDTATGKVVATPNGHTSQVTHIAFSPDGQRLASSSNDNTLKVWDAATGKELATLSGHTRRVYHVAFSPDGQRLASASEDHTARLWDAATGKEISTLIGHADPVGRVAFSPDGQRLASASFDNTVRLWDAAIAKRPVVTLNGHTEWVAHVAFSADGQRLASASGDNSIKLWNVAAGKELFTLSGHKSLVTNVGFSSDGQRLASASSDKTVKLWDATTGKALATFKSDDVGDNNAFAFSPDGQQMATASDHNTLKLWDAATGRTPLIELSGHIRSIQSIAFSPDGKRLAAATNYDNLKLWDAATGKELFSLSGHKKFVTDVAFSPDGQHLASASADDTLKLWDTTTGKELFTLLGHADMVQHVAFSLDGQRVASGSQDHTARLWDAATGKELYTLRGHANWVSNVAFNEDGQRLATVSGDGTIKLWDVETGKELLTLRGNADRIHHVAFSPNGEILAAPSSDGTVKLWFSHESDAQREVRRLAWRENSATAAEAGKNWFAAAFHLTQLLTQRPNDPTLLLRRGRVNRLLKNALLADEDLAKARALGNDAIRHQAEQLQRSPAEFP